MARQLIATILVLLTLSCVMPPNTGGDGHRPVVPSDTTINERTVDNASDYHALSGEPSVLVFDTGDTLRTGLDELKGLARFTDPLGRRWFLFSGRSVDNFKNGISLFILSPGDSTSILALAKPWHMPGRLFMAKDSLLYYETSVFAGEVLPDTFGVIWYDRSLMPDGSWRTNTTLLKCDQAEPDTLVLFGHGRKSSTIDLAFLGKCKILQGTDQYIHP